MREVPKWSGDPTKKTKFERNSVEIPRYVSIEESMKGEVNRIISDVGTKNISRAAALEQFRQACIKHQTEAFVAGRRLRGETTTTISPGEERMLDARLDFQMKHFAKFADDVEHNRGRMNYRDRADMYGEALWSVFTRGETSDWESDPYEYIYYWVLDPDAEHCPTCIERAKLSRERRGFTWDELVALGFPGEGTICLTRCRCHIERKKHPRGKRNPEDFPGQEPMFPPPEPAATPEQGLKSIEELMGGAEEPELPAAGVPFVRVESGVIARSIAHEGAEETLPAFKPVDSVVPSVPTGKAESRRSSTAIQEAPTVSEAVAEIERLPNAPAAIEFVKQLQVLPWVLRKPDDVIETTSPISGNRQRIYVGYGLAVVTERYYGAWWMVLLLPYYPGAFGIKEDTDGHPN